MPVQPSAEPPSPPLRKTRHALEFEPRCPIRHIGERGRGGHPGWHPTPRCGRGIQTATMAVLGLPNHRPLQHDGLAAPGVLLPRAEAPAHRTNRPSPGDGGSHRDLVGEEEKDIHASLCGPGEMPPPTLSQSAMDGFSATAVVRIPDRRNSGPRAASGDAPTALGVPSHLRTRRLPSVGGPGALPGSRETPAYIG